MSYWPGHVVAESLLDESDVMSHANEASLEMNQKASKEAESNSKGAYSKRSNAFKNKNELNEKSLRENVMIMPGGPFSSLVNSMVPFDLLRNSKVDLESKPGNIKKSVSTPNCSDSNAEFFYDEFGFKIENESKQSESNKDKFVDIQLNAVPNRKQINLIKQPFVEDEKHKLKWIAYLEFTLNGDVGSSFAWDQVIMLSKCEKLKGMIRSQGVPHSLRPFIWMRLSGAYKKKLEAKFKYVDILKNVESNHLNAFKQIEKDLFRTLPTNACFSSAKSVGICRLKRVLESIAWLYPTIGYCQGMGTIAATLLLFLEEEDAFWLMSTIIEDILPPSYYSQTLLGVQADMKVLKQLISTYLPEIDAQFNRHDIELSLICINWFLTIFSNVIHIKVLLRIWDLFFYDGSIVLFQITLALLKLNEAELLAADNSSQIFTQLNDIPAELNDVDLLIETCIRVGSSININLIDVSRRKHRAYLIAQNDSISNSMSFQKLSLDKERPRNKSQIKLNANEQVDKSNILNTLKKISAKPIVNLAERAQLTDRNIRNENCDEMKIKNILQSEFLINLRGVIMKIITHFQTKDPSNYQSMSIGTDYSIESHAQDYENYLDNSKAKQFKRAKALLDFDKTEEDELGFRQNDIITILSTKDDHCWIGELNNEKGWFPSRFVEIIDERSGKVYSSAGDDSIDPEIGYLVRGEFFMALKSLFEYGMKKWNILGTSLHPWQFIEEAAKKIVEKDFGVVYSRLILCKTFRLDEDGKVLTPEELLFKSIQLINISHDSSTFQMDAKFRSLLCIGLNEQCLHIWLEILCSSLETVEKWYHKWSFLRSPCWVQIKCELRVLAQFSFLLNADAELPENRKDLKLNECIKDMLIKHHLFSWDIN